MPSFLTPLLELLNAESLGNFKLILIGYIALLWVSIIIWVTRDALSRSNNLFFQALAILLTIGIPILGVFLYLIIRPSKTQLERYYEQLETDVLEGEEKQIEATIISCDQCFTEIKEDYVFCPKCANPLKKVCTSCKKPFEDRWTICPYCGKEYKPKNTVARGARRTSSKPTPLEDLKPTEITLTPE